MQILYRYRWLCAIALPLSMFLLTYHLDIQPGLRQFFNLQAEMVDLQNKLQTLNTHALSTPVDAFILTKPNPIKALSLFNELALKVGLSVQSVNMVRDDVNGFSQGAQSLHFVLQGTYRQIYLFITVLGRQAMPLQILNFKIKTQGERLQIEFDTLAFVDLSRHLPAANKNHSGQMFNPFCVAQFKQKSQRDASLLAAAALSQIKMVGYFARGPMRQGLIALPNGAVVAVTVGEMIGRERAQVLEIERDHITVMTAEGIRVDISM